MYSLCNVRFSIYMGGSWHKLNLYIISIFFEFTIQFHSWFSWKPNYATLPLDIFCPKYIVKFKTRYLDCSGGSN